MALEPWHAWHVQVLMEAQSMAALKQGPLANGHVPADSPAGSSEAQRGFPASRYARQPQVDIATGQSLPNGSTVYRHDLDPPEPMPTESPRDQPTMGTGRSSSLRIDTGRSQESMPTAFAERSQVPPGSSGDLDGSGHYNSRSGWLSPLALFGGVSLLSCTILWQP